MVAMAFGQQQPANTASTTTTTTIEPVTNSTESPQAQVATGGIRTGTVEPRVSSTPTPTPKPQTCHNQITYMPMFIGKMLIEEPITTQVCS